MKLYHNPSCSKSREGLALIEQANQEVEIVKYIANPINEEGLRSIVAKLGIAAEDLVRKKEKIFRENFKGKELSEDDYIQMMVEYPKLIERPILVKGDKAVIGRPPEKILEFLQNN